jgi:predicted DNA-binding transcriptional regulator AlpA
MPPASSQSTTPPQPIAVDELLPMRALLRVLGLKSRQAVYDRLRKIPDFPKPRRVGNYSIAWLASEVAAWQQSLPIAELDGFDAIERRRSTS